MIASLYEVITHCQQSLIRVLSGTCKLEIWILSGQVQKWPGICPKKGENLDKTRNIAENLDKTWNVKIYKISILYWDNFFHVLYCWNFKTSLVSAFWCQNCPHYNLENDLLTWTKPGDNLELYDLNKLWTLLIHSVIANCTSVQSVF